MDMNTSILPIEKSGYPIGQLSNPSQGQKLNLEKLSNEEVERFFNGSNDISHIKFIDRNGKEGEAFYTTKF
jgi:hypothetical protein